MSSFFAFNPKPEEAKPSPNQKEPQKMNPFEVIIDGDASNLIKVVEDNTTLEEVKLDKLTPFGWTPFNYEMKEVEK